MIKTHAELRRKSKGKSGRKCCVPYEGMGAWEYNSKFPEEFIRRLKLGDSETWLEVNDVFKRYIGKNEKIREEAKKLDLDEDEICNRIYEMVRGSEQKLDKLRKPTRALYFLRSQIRAILTAERGKRGKLIHLPLKGWEQLIVDSMNSSDRAADGKKKTKMLSVGSPRSELMEVRELVRACVGELWQKNKEQGLIVVLKAQKASSEEIAELYGFKSANYVDKIYASAKAKIKNMMLHR